MKFQLVQPRQISPYDNMGKSNFNHVLNYFFIPLSRAEAINWQNFVPAKRDASNTKEGSHLVGMKLFTFNRGI